MKRCFANSMRNAAGLETMNRRNLAIIACICLVIVFLTGNDKHMLDTAYRDKDIITEFNNMNKEKERITE